MRPEDKGRAPERAPGHRIMVIALVLYVWTVLSFLMGILFGRTMRLPGNQEIPRPSSRIDASGFDRAVA